MNTFSPKIDIISENIIYLLSLDSRITVSELAKILSKERRVVENRLSKLYANKLIKPLLIYNYKDLVKATILIKITKFDQEVITSIEKIRDLIKLKETLGLYDLSLLIITEGEKEFYKELYQVNKLLHNSIQSMDVIVHDMEDTLGYKSFCHDLGLLTKYQMLNPDKKYELSAEERQIINLLKIKPDLSYRELIKKTGLNYVKIKKTISKCMEKNIIRFSVDPDYHELGLEFHNLLIRINLAKRNKFEKNIINNHRIHWVKKGSGRWDYIISICSKNISEFINISREIRTKNKDIILEFSSLVSKINVTRKN